MMEKRVPNELVDCILENLYFDRDTLINCALVGKAWVRSSQLGIFREIVLKLPRVTNFAVSPATDGYLEADRRLDALFSEKPHLASYVRSLKLTSFLVDYDTEPAMPAEACTATASLVQRLSEVNKLAFCFLEWEILPPLLKVALTELCKASSLTQFTTINFEIPTFTELASLLNDMRSLKVLVLHVSMYSDHWDALNSLPESVTKPRRIQLTDLRLISYVHRFMTWFQQDWCPFDVRRLNSLEIGREVDMAALQYCGTNLRELKLQRLLPSYYDSNTNLAHLGCTPNLRSLSLMTAYEPSLDKLATVTWIQSLFKPLLNSHGHLFPLQHLTISLGTKSSNLLQPHQWEPWAEIDALLQKPEFALLETVDFKLRSVTRETPDDARQLLRGNLPFLEGSGKLVVQIER
ncbi:hypothetical protein BT96DRAFT_1020512 [Gymnopus androsaceus JB14]|uniref:F-box domain-containing protein n=1 Tax=Gymnopus androsaceus JB14 TaxID=1447944 RepID=A0A6A4HGS7_9AGAR|nr:hypothetical protein BT96DRAFT_1020512 [Gymnopus androsaceus JB14]